MGASTVCERNNWIFFPTWVFFHNHSQITGLQGEGESISLTLHYHFHPIRYRHLGISWVIAAGSSALGIASSCTQVGNSLFPTSSCKLLSYIPYIWRHNIDFVYQTNVTNDLVETWSFVQLTSLLKIRVAFIHL